MALGSYNLWGAAALGVLQGFTEFLPVSSSGHLVVGGHLMQIPAQSLLFDVLLHLGTLLPVLWLYRRDLAEIFAALPGLAHPGRAWRESRGFRLGICVVLGTLPTGLIGVALEKQFEALFSNLTAVGITFCITGGILWLTRLGRARAGGAEEPADSHLSLSAGRALAVGLAQGLAITPGISRSGTTIAAALLLGIERAMAARLSFLLSVPAILGAVALHLRKLGADTHGEHLPAYLAGALAAAITGYLALRWLVALVRRGGLHWFSLYLWPLGLTVLVYALLF